MTIEKAEAFARKHHARQTGKAGLDYMQHVLQVYENVCAINGSQEAQRSREIFR